MHELAVAHELLERALEAAEERGVDTVTSMALEVGTVTHVNPTQLANCLAVIADGTLAEGASVEVETLDPRGQCSCGWEGEPRTLEDFGGVTPDPNCPECGDQIELTGGRECRLASITVPDDPPKP